MPDDAGKVKKSIYGLGFFWFAVAMVVVGLIVAAIGAARDTWEDRKA